MSTEDEDGRRSTLAAEVVLGILVSATRAGTSALRLAAFPARAVAGDRIDATERRLAWDGRRVAGQGRDLLGALADDALAGPLPESVLEAVEEHHVVARIAESPALERLLASDAFADLVDRVVSAPAVRSAVARQTRSYGSELRGQLVGRLATLDDRLGQGWRRAFQRPPAVEASAFGGLAVRGVALVLDLAGVAVAASVAAGAVALVESLIGRHGAAWLVGLFLGSAWAVLANAYLVACWTLLGQTPGMRLLGVRVETTDGGELRAGRALLRAVGLALALLPLGAGLVPVVGTRRRRGLHDWIAGTTVRFDPSPTAGDDSPRAEPGSSPG